MSQLKPWVKPLNISIKDYETWSASVKPGENVTFWALDRGKIKAQDYLFWAREHYQIPVLKDSYFQDFCNQKLWQQIQSVANWSPHLLPVDEWDGIIYVACVEPPGDVSWSFPVQYVLASARTLKTHYQRLQSGEDYGYAKTSAAAAVDETQTPDVDELDLPDIPVSLDVPGFENTDIGQEQDHLAAIEIPPADESPQPAEFTQHHEGEQPTESKISLDIPEANEVIASSEPASEETTGLNIPEDLKLDLPPTPDSIADTPEGISLNFDSQASDNSPEGISLDLSSDNDNSPEGISLGAFGSDDASPEGISLDLADSGQEFSLDLPDSPDAVSLDIPEVPTAEDTMDAAGPGDSNTHEGLELPDIPESTYVSAAVDETLTASGHEETPPTLPEVSAGDEAPAPEFRLKFDLSEGGVDDSPPEPSQITTTTQTNEHTVTKFAITTTGVNKDAPKGAVIDTDQSAPHTSDSVANEVEAAAWLFSELKQHFQQSMILLAQGNELKPWKWENSWSPKSKEAFEGFNPDQPGLFRIIKRTKQPYHGYVVDSPLNKSFFQSWGFAKFPEHVTALPMKVEGHLTGIILSIGDDSSATDRALIDAEKIVDEFVSTIIRVSSLAA